MEIHNYREQAPGGWFVGLFDVYLPKVQLTFKNLKLCVSKQGKHFIGYPSFSEESDIDGKKKWIPFFEFSQERKKEFENGVMEAIGPFVKGGIVRFKN